MSEEFKVGDLVRVRPNVVKEIVAVHGNYLWVDPNYPFTTEKKFVEKVELKWEAGKVYAHRMTGNTYEVVYVFPTGNAVVIWGSGSAGVFTRDTMQHYKEVE